MTSATSPTSTQPLLRVSGLRYTYPTGTAAIDLLDLDIRRGECVSLIGPSGCGKSTLLGVLAGLLPLQDGRLDWEGAPVPSLRGKVAYMPQDDALFDWRTVRDNVALAQELAGARRRDARAVAQRTLDEFGLGEFAGFYPSALSGGMRSRVAFLRTILAERPLLLLDEPFGALDSITRATLQTWLRSTALDRGFSLLLVTHDIPEAVFLSDTVVVLTPRPAAVAGTVDVPLGSRRDEVTRIDDAFFRCCADVSRVLECGMRAKAPTDPLRKEN